MSRAMTTLRSVPLLLGALLLGSCEENAVQDITGPMAESRIKFFHFGVNAPQVNFYANDTKVTAIGSTTGAESTIGTAYGAAGAGGFYAAVPAGEAVLAGKISATTDNGLAIAQVTQPIETGKSYSYYLSGFYNTTAKTVEAFVVEDPYPAEIDWSQAYVRFVHAISNANPMALVVKNTTTLVESPVGDVVAYKGAGAFVAIPAGGYDLYTRYTSGGSNVITRTAVSFAVGRVYTITARGDITVTGTTATNRPQLDNTANR
jgi:hypothetical protein